MVLGPAIAPAVAHALLRAASALVPTPAAPGRGGVEWRLDAARRSACATAPIHEVHAMKQWIFRLLGKGPEAVVVTFSSGEPGLCRRMAEEVRSLVPDRRHFVATAENWPSLQRELKPYRIGLAPVMLTRQ